MQSALRTSSSRCLRAIHGSTHITTSPIFDQNSSPVSSPHILYAYFRDPVPYSTGLSIQRNLVSRRLHAKETLLKSPQNLSSNEIEKLQRIASNDILLFLQHKPVYTAGNREKDPVLTGAERERLEKLGAEYFLTDRGGQTTYHGPGQLVGYPIFDLNLIKMPTRTFVYQLEQFITELLASRLGVPTVKSEHIGIFTSPTSKIASIGLHLTQRITSHGFAINIEDSVIPWFDNIVACGLHDVHAISTNTMRSRAGLAPIAVHQVIPAAVDTFSDIFARPFKPIVNAEDPELLDIVSQGGQI